MEKVQKQEGTQNAMGGYVYIQYKQHISLRHSIFSVYATVQVCVYTLIFLYACSVSDCYVHVGT